MADETTQGEAAEQDARTGDETGATDRRDGDTGGDEDKPGAALLKALKEEREARARAEADLRKREKADREAETARAIKAGEWEAVAKAKDGEIADLNARIADLEGAIAAAQLETVRERVAARHKLPAELAARLRGATEAELDADAKGLAKLIVRAVPDTQVGGGQGQGKPNTIEQEKQAQIATGRYSAIA